MRVRTPKLDYSDKGWTYYLNDEMLRAIGDEFNPNKVTEKAAAKSDIKEMRRIFEEYGRDLAKRSLDLGKKYPERNYEVIKQVAEQTRVGSFPHEFQRFLEIAYLGVLPIPEIKVIQCNRDRLRYIISPCAIFDSLQQKCPKKILNKMPCQEACLSLCRTLSSELGLSLQERADMLMAADNLCQFTVERKS